MHMKHWDLEFPFQKHILLYYLPNSVQVCSFWVHLSSKARIQGTAVPQKVTDRRANRVGRIEAGGQEELQDEYGLSGSDLLLFNCVSFHQNRKWEREEDIRIHLLLINLLSSLPSPLPYFGTGTGSYGSITFNFKFLVKKKKKV